MSLPQHPAESERARDILKQLTSEEKTLWRKPSNQDQKSSLQETDPLPSPLFLGEAFLVLWRLLLRQNQLKYSGRPT